MSTRERPIDRGRRQASADRARLGGELRVARVILGRSLESVASAAGMSASQAGRIERGVLATVSIDQVARLGAVVGLDVRVRAYPGPDPDRTKGQSALLARLFKIMPAGLAQRTEVPLPVPGDQRAWDVVMYGLLRSDGSLAPPLPTEAETRVVDVQAQTRRILLKLRDSGMDSVLVLVADTQANRDAVRASEHLLAGDFPVSARTALRELRAGRYPGGSAIVLL